MKQLRWSLLLVLLPFVAGCELFGEDDAPEPEVFSNQSADFGLRAVFGLNPDAAGSPRVFAGLLYDQNNERIFMDDERVSLTFNGEVVRGALFLDYSPFEYTPGARYELEVSLDGKRVSGAITAPSISDIQLVSLPDTLCDNEPLTVQWSYPEGEHNDGMLLVTGRGYNSGHLSPGTTSHTIPAGAFYWGDQAIQVRSIRSVLYPKLHKPVDWGIQFELGYTGSFFSTFIMSDVYYTYVKQAEYEDGCAGQFIF